MNSRRMRDQTDQRIRLPDGRWLGFAEFGDPNGKPAFLFHGIPGSRLEAGLVDADARANGIRIIGVDRPGMGNSTFQPERTFLDWPEDIGRLADQLELDRFAIIGISGGGAYVSACAVTMPERITSAGICSGMGPLSFPDDLELLGVPYRGLRYLIGLARRAPGMMSRLLSWKIGWDEHRQTDPLVAISASISQIDRPVLMQPGVGEGLVRDFGEAMRQGTLGVAWDLVMYAQPWGFQLDDVPIDIYLWHGEADTDVPVTFAQRVAERIPRCHAKFFQDDGHFMAITHSREILTTMKLAMK